MTVFRKQPTFSFRFSENGNLLSVSFSRKKLPAGTAVMPFFYTATRMLTTHQVFSYPKAKQVLSYPQASILSSTASLVKLSPRVARMGPIFLWPIKNRPILSSITTYISWSSNFAIYLEDYLMDKCHSWNT